MRIRCFLTREDALIYPETDEEFRYENGWPFLEVIKKGQTSKLINKNQIREMDIEVATENIVIAKTQDVVDRMRKFQQHVEQQNDLTEEQMKLEAKELDKQLFKIKEEML